MSDNRFYKIIWKKISEISKKGFREITAKDVLWMIILELLFFTIIIAPAVAEAYMPMLFSSIRRFLGKARYLLFKKIIDLKSQKHKNYILTDENFGLTSENHKLTDRNCELTNINRALIDEKNLLTNINRELIREEYELAKRSCALTDEKNQVTKENSELNNEIFTLKIKISQLEAKGKINNPSESNIMVREEALGILRIDARNPSQAEISDAYRNVVARFHPDTAPVEQSAKEELLRKNLHYLSAHSLYETVQEASKGECIYIDKLFKSTAEKIVFEATQARDFLTDYEDKIRQMDRERREQNEEGLSR